MKNIVAIAIAVGLIFFATVAQAKTDEDFGWKAIVDHKGVIMSLSNIGDQGGLLTLTCDVKTHKLNMVYSTSDNTVYDMFVFRKFGVADMTTNDDAGKFIVGGGVTSQGSVYYNVLNANRAFVIARMPVGSKALLNKAVKNNDPEAVKQITQEGDEYFVAGDDVKRLLGALSVDCPVNSNSKDPIF